MPEAEKEYRTALRLDPNFVPALVNLADLDRARGMDDEGAELLDEGDGDRARQCRCPLRARSLLWCASSDYAGALDLLRRAHELMPDNARYAYVYAVALNSSGKAQRRRPLLEQAHQQHPADRDVLMALVSIARDQGDFAAALRYARELVTLDPGNAQLRELISELEKRTKR